MGRAAKRESLPPSDQVLNRPGFRREPYSWLMPNRLAGHSRATNTLNRICFIGAMPPPVHGVSVVNTRIVDLVRAAGALELLIDTAPSAPRWGRGDRTRRIRTLGTALLKYCAAALARRIDTVYVGLSGGAGLVFDVLVVSIGRLFGLKLFLHHHSYAYLRRPTIVSRVLVWVAGPRTTHIVLCVDMKNRLIHSHTGASSVFVLSFGATIDSVETNRARLMPLRVGYLGNIMASKGIFEYIEVMDRLTELYPAVEGRIAGPFWDVDIENQVLARARGVARLSFIGPVHGEAKKTFLNGIDVLLFPSSYAHEADPTVVHEALAAGVPVIAWDRGCIRSWLTPDCGMVVGAMDSFVEAALAQMLAWLAEPDRFSAASTSAKSIHSEHCKEERKKLQLLLHKVLLDQQL